MPQVTLIGGVSSPRSPSQEWRAAVFAVAGVVVEAAELQVEPGHQRGHVHSRAGCQSKAVIIMNALTLVSAAVRPRR